MTLPPCYLCLQIESALLRKEKGNAAYKAGKLVRAAKQYNKAVETATSVQEKDMAPKPVDASTGEFIIIYGSFVGSLRSSHVHACLSCLL